ncbi:acyl-CoA synthetase [Limobrevibacterium gyesilva]|uniref:Acyl-CoA synthetase n=1 Tax=Limobrevibacterium gyesilva TaxID=2991712 RepID=A0AA41YKB3_9PROT|nr:acyl-CoA synthetase [Limobrevibacterium gyesilva]MCW3475379.1 acyl-CoA synthetase [Limobrevibacterium gyesilva]
MIPTSNLAHFLLQTARRFPDRAGLIRGEHVWTWAEVAARVRAAAGGLRACGVGKGDRVLVHARNSHAMFETMWASWMLGAVWVPTNVRLTPPEVAYLAQSSGAVAHVFDDAFPDHEAAARDANPNATVHLRIGADWDGLAHHGAPLAEAVAVDRDDPCWFFYTSGTTGRPKAAMLTHGQMVFVVTNHLCDLMPGTSEHDVSLVVAPLSHGAGIHALAQVARGAATVLMPGERLDCAEAWRLVEKHHVSNMFTVPTILTMLTRDAAVDRVDHSSLRYVIYAGAPMYRADQVHALRKLGPVLVQYFGLGEVTGNITVLPPHLHSIDDDPAFPIGSCGYPRTGMEISIRDGEGRGLPAGETGEICVRGPAVFAGYFDDSEATAKAFAGGWFHTGDLGHLDAKGFLYITGRASDMYISGGSNVYPREIEEALLLHPAIAEACVVGMPDAKWGESGVAVLVARDGNPPPAEDVLRQLDGRLARYKWPARIVFWDALPKSGYGKVTKRDVRRRLEEAGPA